MNRFLIAIVFLLAAGPGLAQSSAGYTLDEHTLNQGGGSASSASFRISMSSLGEGLTGPTPASPSYAMDAGFVIAYRPPVEVQGLQFLDHDNLEWTADPAAASYNLYRDLVSSLSGLGYGHCSQQELGAPSANDGDVSPAGDGYFYLATAVNRLSEEGGKGADSESTERSGTTCP